MMFGVLGSGRQGTAAAYDLAVAQGAHRVVMFDADDRAAQAAAERVNRLAMREVACGQRLDARDDEALVAALAPLGVAVCALPFRLIPACTRAAIEAHTGMVDLGGHTDTVLGQQALDDQARAARIAIVPDCGMGPPAPRWPCTSLSSSRPLARCRWRCASATAACRTGLGHGPIGPPSISTG
jgi:saccharopine dehydrogenase-like NADP-dependent oxidoreductase